MESRVIFSFLAIDLVGCVSAYPRFNRAVENQPNKNAALIESTGVNSKDKFAQIILSVNEFNPEDNSYVFQYETDNGIKVQGFAKDNKVSVQGSYFLILADGNQVPVQYKADENGFQVDSPAIPTPHPLIAKVAAYLRTIAPQKEEVEESNGAGSAKGPGIDV